MLPLSFQEYSLTLGILIAFVGTITAFAYGLKYIKDALKEFKLTRNHLILLLLIALAFVLFEIYMMKPTQLLFFDDAIYQGMALDLLRTGQAWMCNYGTPTACFSGEIFHEPIGTSFNIALAYALAGVTRSAAYDTGLVIAVVAIIAIFFCSLLLLKNLKAAFFSSLLLALSPALLVWARPTNSDLPTLACSLIVLFSLLICLKRKNIITFSMLGFSAVLVMYMKINAIAFLVAMFVVYIILDDKDIVESLNKNYETAKECMLNTRFLILLLVLVVAVLPEISYTYNELLNGDYGYQGTPIQNSCNSAQTITVSGSFNLQNFEYNSCANVFFWFDQYKGINVMQPVLFTALALLGVIFLAFYKRRILFAVAIWFGVLFALYTSFYAGAVTYGVDWRFMLSMIAQICMLGGFAVAMLYDYANEKVVEKINISAKRKIAKGKMVLYRTRVNYILALVAITVIFYPVYSLIPQLGIPQANVIEAPDARFYENFIYNDSKLIPSGCLVYSYDPTLFFINNRTSTQLSDIYNSSEFQNRSAQYKCSVVDYGYWCYTPNNLCTNLRTSFNLTPIATATFQQFNRTYGLYYVKSK